MVRTIMEGDMQGVPESGVNSVPVRGASLVETVNMPEAGLEPTISLQGQSSAARFDFRVLQALRRVIRAVDLHSRKLSVAYRITALQLRCLLAVEEHGFLTPSAIARHVHVSPSSVIGILDRLEAKGFVRRQRGVKDRRLVHVSLTDSGRALVEIVPSPLQDTLVHGLRDLPVAEQEVIVESLERIVELMEARNVVAEPNLTTGPTDSTISKAEAVEPQL
jgi:DNA-binding MarR family transcriptional regulator